MLKAAEEELKVRSDQLSLTNEMLRTTEEDLKRKDEQVPGVQAALVKYAKALQAATDKGEQAEPDGPAMIKEVKKLLPGFEEEDLLNVKHVSPFP